MTRYEKVLLFLLLLFLGMTIAAVSGGSAPLFLGLWVLTISYLIGGYWLFNRETISRPVRIAAGVAFAAAVISFNYTSGVLFDTIYLLLPVVNGLFCIGLGCYLLLHRRVALPALRGLWLRSVLLLGISAFFAYSPISFRPYRKALIALNSRRENIVSNLRMFDYSEAYDEAMDREDYPAALAYGQQALKLGLQWLGEDSVKLRWRISGNYTNLYGAYKLMGDAAYNQRRYPRALEAYQTGHRLLVTGDHRENGSEQVSSYWQKENAWSLNNMALCYLKLSKFEAADSLFLAAIKAYQKVQPAPDVHFARLAGDVATSLAAQGQYSAANKVLQKVDRHLLLDTTRGAAAMRVKNVLATNLNYVKQDSLTKGLRVLQAIAWPRGDTSGLRYQAMLQEAVCRYKLGQYGEVERTLQPALTHFKRQPRFREGEALCYVMLARNSLVLASYSRAQGYAEAALAKLPAESRGTESARSLIGSCRSVLGALNKALGHYQQADQELVQAVEAARPEADNSSGALSEALMQLADLDVVLGREGAAEAHVSEALSLLQGKPVTLPSQTGVLATAAYVDYALGRYREAGRKYRQVVAVNTRFGQGQNVNTATAWNGLGLVELAQRRYDRADSLFQQAQRLHEQLFTDRHPLTASVYLHYGLLRLKQNRNREAAQLIEKARGIAQAFLPADHDMFADLAVALGDLATSEKRAAAAQGYYQQALALYAQKFPASHWKVKGARQKAGA